ncbi:alpha/beta hydrolase-fold protein [Arthrobacter sp. Soc17.1.1.1]|uniref:alpha/beta hydrolase n=1 Tax=Arthrobacter sp. Soc17.1.1.1 TaxID=3121277 RepID=UPI002FE47090
MNPLDWDLVDGPAPLVFAVLAGAALLWLASGPWRYLVRSVVPCLLVGAVGGLALWLGTEVVLNLWGAPQPFWFYLLGGLAIAGGALAVRRFAAFPRWWQRCLTVVAPVLIITAVAGSINAYYGSFPTLRAATGDTDIPELGTVDAPKAPGPLTTLADWSPPSDMPSTGKVYRTTIPGTASGVDAGPAYVYLPPAYLASSPAIVPVLVLIHGDPGGPQDWITGGQLPAVLDAYAAAHKGLAPIAVLPDAAASTGPTPSLCLDSNYGRAGTYLAEDVPAWVESTLGAGSHADTDRAIGGFSYGGTCSLTLAFGHPGVYPTFLDISGEDRPTIDAGQDALISNYFSGDAAAFAAQNPLDVVRTKTFPGTAGIVTVGADDSFYRPQGEEVAAALQKAGVDVQLQTVPGGHTWEAWKAGLQNNLDWLMQRYGVLPGSG